MDELERRLLCLLAALAAENTRLRALLAQGKSLRQAERKLPPWPQSR